VTDDDWEPLGFCPRTMDDPLWTARCGCGYLQQDGRCGHPYIYERGWLPCYECHIRTHRTKRAVHWSLPSPKIYGEPPELRYEPEPLPMLGKEYEPRKSVEERNRQKLAEMFGKNPVSPPSAVPKPPKSPPEPRCDFCGKRKCECEREHPRAFGTRRDNEAVVYDEHRRPWKWVRKGTPQCLHSKYLRCDVICPCEGCEIDNFERRFFPTPENVR
jgi:hypothetical protein